MVVGCGLAGAKMPQNHLEGYRQHPQCQVVGVIDNDWFKIKGAPVAGTRMNALKHYKPDIVSICTPETSHLRIFRETMHYSTPLGIFMEKPLATTMEGCEEIIETCESRGVALQVNHARAWDPDVCRMTGVKEIKYGGKRWRNDVHAFHLANMLVGSPIVTQVAEPGLWADDEPLWGNLRPGTMVKAISDLIAVIEGKKEFPESNAFDAMLAVESVLLQGDIEEANGEH